MNKKFRLLSVCLLLMVSILSFSACKKSNVNDDAYNKEQSADANDNTNNEQQQQEDQQGQQEEQQKEQDNQQEDQTQEKEPITMKVATLKGPTGMGMSKLMEDAEKEQTENKYDFSLYGAPDQLTAKIINGEVDIAAVPTNLASVLYNKTNGQVQLAAINTLGVLYIVEAGNEIQSIQDLKGKQVWASGKGATPEYVLNYLLKENGIDPEKNIEINYSLQHAELAAAVTAGDVPIALLPQPHVTTATMKDENIRIALDLTEVWKNTAANDSQLAMGCLIVNKAFADTNKEAVNNFLNEYKQSVDWVNQNVTEASELIEKFEILPKAKIAEIALPKCNIVYIDANESKDILAGLYQVLYDFNPKSLGGKIPDDNFYYQQ